MRERDDLKFPGMHNCLESDSLHCSGRRMKLNCLDLLNDELYALGKAYNL